MIVPHQANGRLIGAVLASEGLNDRARYTLDRYGNTGAASVAITLDDAARSGRLKRGDIALLIGFGGGMTIGTALVRWSLPAGPGPSIQQTN